MPTYADAAALSALFNPSTGTVDFKVVLRTAGTIAVDTRAISFFVNMANDIIEAELSAAELQALITADDQAAIIYKLKVSPIPPIALVCYAVEQSTSGTDFDLPLDAAFAGLIKLTAKPSQPRQPEVNNLVKVVAVSGAANKLDITADVKLFLSANFGGADASTYNVQVINGNAPTRSSGSIQTADIANGYVLFPLSLSDVKSEDRILISHNNDNASGDQSRLSLAAIIIASLKPDQASFTAESGKLDDVANVYIPLKIKYNVADNIFDRVNVLRKAGTWAVADYFLRTTDTDNEMLANGFVEFKVIRTAAGSNPIGAFAKLELAISLSKGAWSSTDKATQSKQSESIFAVAGAKKFAVTHTSTSTYTAQTADASVAPKHTFAKTYTFPAAPAQIVLVASLLQNGVQVDAKTIVIAAAATSSAISFDRLASLVKKDDKFRIVGQIKTAIEDANAQFLPANTTLGGKAALCLAERVESKELVAQPLPDDMKTALDLKEADDFLSSGVRRLFTRFELNQASNQDPYNVASYDVEMALDATFNTLLQLASDASTRINILVDSTDGKKLDESLVLTRFAGGAATSLTPKQLMFIRYRTNHTWIGGGTSVVSRPWVVYQYIVSEEDQTAAPVINNVKQENVDQLKVSFVNGAAVQFIGVATNGVLTKCLPTLTKFVLLDEIGRILKTHIVNHEGNYAADVDTRISLGPEMLDQYVRVKAVRQYVNPLNGVSIESDTAIFAEVFVAKKLVIRSIQVVETALKIKLIADIDFGRTLSSEVTARAVLPWKNGNTDEFITGNISYDAVEKKHIIELDKQLDPQGSKYGPALKVYLFVSGAFGQLVSSVFPSN